MNEKLVDYLAGLLSLVDYDLSVKSEFISWFKNQKQSIPLIENQLIDLSEMINNISKTGNVDSKPYLLEYYLTINKLPEHLIELNNLIKEVNAKNFKVVHY